MKRFLKLSALVLAIALVGAFVLNLSKPFKQLTQKKVVNPENVFQSENVMWDKNISKNGVSFQRNSDGSWHIFGTATSLVEVYLTLSPIQLEDGKTYTLTSGMKNDGLHSYYLKLVDSESNSYFGDLEPEKDSNTLFFGPFVASGSLTYSVVFRIPNAGAVIDEVIYPCLVEGTEPGDFYIYK